MNTVLERYLVEHDLQGSTEAWYRRVWHIWREWSGDGPLVPERVSEFLRWEQTRGVSSYYRRGLRSALTALMRSAGITGRVRPVRLDPLIVEAWSAEEVGRLVNAVPRAIVDPLRQVWWGTLIQAAWYSGLSQGDLHTITPEMVPQDGWLRGRRSKTGRPVAYYLPRPLVEHAADGHPVWPLDRSRETLRIEFRMICAAAGLRGSFKRLRKSAASDVEERSPGRGHVYIGDTRAVFERHYWRQSIDRTVRPQDLPRIADAG